MAQFSAKKINTANINGGQEITDGSGATPEVFNAPINSALYTEKAIDVLTSQIDTTGIDRVGTPTASFATKNVGGIAYRYLKLENLKGQQGQTGQTGPQGETGKPAGFGTPVIIVNNLPAGSDAIATVTATGSDTAKVFKFTLGIPKGEQGIQGERGLGIKSVSTSGNDLVITFDDNSTQVVKDALKPINELPQTSSSDAGKFFMVGANGEVVVRALPIAEELYV